MRFFTAAGLMLLVVAPTWAVTDAEYAAIFAPPECEAASLSRDGRLLALLIRSAAGSALRVLDLDAAEVKSTIRISVKAVGAGPDDEVHWLGATRLFAQVGSRDFVAVDVDGGNPVSVVDWSQPIWHNNQSPHSEFGVARHTRLVGFPGADPGYVHIETSWSRNTKVFRVNVGTGRPSLAWEADLQGHILYDHYGVARIQDATWQNTGNFLLRTTGGGKTPWIPLDDAAGTRETREFAVTAGTLHGPRAVPLAFGRDRDLLYFASNAGRNTFGIYAVDLRTGRRTGFSLEHGTVDLALPAPQGFGLPQTALVWDRQSGELAGVRHAGPPVGVRFADPVLQSVQSRVEHLAPAHEAYIEEWDDGNRRFLVRGTTRSDPGFLAIYDRAADTLRSVVTCAPALAGHRRPHSTPWSYPHADGTTRSGRLTLPGEPGTVPTPVVVLLSSGLWGPPSTGYSGQVRALAQMGYAVLEVNYRGTTGLGRSHLEAARGKVEAVMAEDVFGALDRLAAKAGLARGKIAVAGSGFGGTAALKLAQLHPQRIACVIAEWPLADLPATFEWSYTTSPGYLRVRGAQEVQLGGPREELKRWSPAVIAPAITAPVMLAAMRAPDSTASSFDSVIRKMKSAGNRPQVIEVSSFEEWRVGRARISAATEKFLRQHLPRTQAP
jgi:dipeptidyl aminopeptidase/acylaminoacyl peptidase